MGAGEQTNNVQGQNAESRLWRFAVELYARPGVAKACLEAQEEWSVDVNLLLCACWCASEGQSLTADDFQRGQARCEAWRDAVILPLREQRKLWQEVSGRGEEYVAIKALELHAERTQLEFLAKLFEQGARAAQRSEVQTLALWEANLCALAQHYVMDVEVLSQFLATARAG